VVEVDDDGGFRVMSGDFGASDCGLMVMVRRCDDEAVKASTEWLSLCSAVSAMQAINKFIVDSYADIDRTVSAASQQRQIDLVDFDVALKMLIDLFFGAMTSSQDLTALCNRRDDATFPQQTLP